MAERILMRRRGDMLVPEDSAGIDALRKMPTDRTLGATVVVPRNIGLHRKAFALVNLAFDYWEPSSFVTAVERQTIAKLGRFLIDNGMDLDTVANLANQFVRHLSTARQTVEAEKSFDAFRDFVTVEAGYYSVIHTPAGPRKDAKSWSFASMDDQEFAVFFKALLAACWRLVLSQHFDSQEAAEAAAMQLLEFD